MTLTADMAKIRFGEIMFPERGRNGAVNYRDLALTAAACEFGRPAHPYATSFNR